MNLARPTRSLAAFALLCLALTAGCAAALRADAPLAWEAGAGFRSAPLSITPGGKAGFTRVMPEESGVTFTNLLPESRHHDCPLQGQ